MSSYVKSSMFRSKIFAIVIVVMMFSSSIPLGSLILKPAFAQVSSLTDDQLISALQSNAIDFDTAVGLLNDAGVIDVMNTTITNLHGEVTQLQNSNQVPINLGHTLSSAFHPLGNAQDLLLNSNDIKGADDMINATNNMIKAFINQVQAQSGKKISTSTANHLISEATQISKISQLRGRALTPFIGNTNLSVTSQVLSRADTEFAYSQSLLSEMQSRGISLHIQVQQHSPAVLYIIAKGIFIAYFATSNAYRVTNLVNQALVQQGVQPLTTQEKLELFYLNSAIFGAPGILADSALEKALITNLGLYLIGQLSLTALMSELNETYADSIIMSLNLVPSEVALITRTRGTLPSTLIIIKRINNTGGGTLSIRGVNLMINGNTVTNGTTMVETAGNYVVSETAIPNYQSVISGDCASDGVVTLAVGDSKTCIITNTFTSPIPTYNTGMQWDINGNFGPHVESDCYNYYPTFYDNITSSTNSIIYQTTAAYCEGRILRIDISSIPNNAVINSVSFQYNVTSIQGTPPACALVDIMDDPLIASSTIIWSDMYGGVNGITNSSRSNHISVSSDSQCDTIGSHHTDTLDSQGIADMTSQVRNGKHFFAIAMTYSTTAPNSEITYPIINGSQMQVSYYVP